MTSDETITVTVRRADAEAVVYGPLQSAIRQQEGAPKGSPLRVRVALADALGLPVAEDARVAVSGGV